MKEELKYRSIGLPLNEQTTSIKLATRKNTTRRSIDPSVNQENPIDRSIVRSINHPTEKLIDLPNRHSFTHARTQGATQAAAEGARSTSPSESESRSAIHSSIHAQHLAGNINRSTLQVRHNDSSTRVLHPGLYLPSLLSQNFTLLRSLLQYSTVLCVLVVFILDFTRAFPFQSSSSLRASIERYGSRSSGTCRSGLSRGRNTSLSIGTDHNTPNRHRHHRSRRALGFVLLSGSRFALSISSNSQLRLLCALSSLKKKTVSLISCD